MAAQNNLFAQILILTVYLVSALTSTSTRDPKELLIFRYSHFPSYRVPFTRFSNGSPINPMIGQQGLGPFFGYFPNFLSQPCPANTDCKNPTVSKPPVVPALPPPGNITECGELFNTPLSVAPNGTINLNVFTNSTSLTCNIYLASFYPNYNIKLYCDTIGADITAIVGPTQSGTVDLQAKTNFVSKWNFLFISFRNSAKVSYIVTNCAWTNVPA